MSGPELRERLDRIRLYAQDALDNGWLSGGAIGNMMSIRDEVDAITAALSAAPQPAPAVGGWKDISTAPKEEGVSVLLGWALEGNWPPCIGFWSGDYHGAHAWCDDATESDFTPQPTHWMPLPAKPVSKGT